MSKKCIKSDLARVDRLKDKDIDYSDIPAFDKSFVTRVAEAWPPTKQQVTIRLDTDVVEWAKAQGRGYQTRINRILRAAMESQPIREKRTSASKSSRSSRGLKSKLAFRVNK